MKLSLSAIVSAVAGEFLYSPSQDVPSITNIVIDSRQVTPGSLYIPIKGDRFDGHHFISSVSEQGALAVLTENREVLDKNLYTIYVEDTKKALLDLASYYRSLFDIPLIGVTGSVGKTSTKDLISAILSYKWNVHKTSGNFNNEIGLPLTLFQLEKNHDMAVIEMGMNHFGEIHRLTMTARPTIAVITNIGTSHIENLGSREGIRKAKLEILDGLVDSGLFIINGDDDMLAPLKSVYPNAITYGKGEHNHYYATHVKTTNGEITATVVTPSNQYTIMIPTLGEHMIYNSLVGIAIGEYLGLSVTEIQQGLLRYTPGKMRMHQQTFANGITVIDDTYNASPDSMKAAIKVLESYETKGRKIAILGDMFEMGSHAQALHAEVGEYIATAAIDEVYTVGEMAVYITNSLHNHPTLRVAHFATQQACLDSLNKHIAKNDTLLFKASRGMQFEKMVEEIGKVTYDEK